MNRFTVALFAIALCTVALSPVQAEPLFFSGQILEFIPPANEDVADDWNLTSWDPTSFDPNDDSTYPPEPPLEGNVCINQTTYAMIPGAPAEDSKAYIGASYVYSACSVLFNHTAEASYVLPAKVTFDIFVGCDVASYIFELDVKLFVEGVEAAHTFYNGVTGDPIVCNPETDVVEVLLEVDTERPKVEIGQNLSATVYAFGNPNGAPVDGTGGNWHIKVGPSYPSGIRGNGLPTVFVPEENESPKPIKVYQDITGEAVDLDHTWATPRNATHTYNWTTDGTDFDISYKASLDEGGVSLAILDGDGSEVLSKDLTAGEDTSTFEGLATGTWTITLVYEGAVGDFSLDITEVVEEEPEETTTSSTTSTTTTTTSTTSGPAPQGDNSNGIPGFGGVALVASLGAVLALRRQIGL